VSVTEGPFQGPREWRPSADWYQAGRRKLADL